MFGCRNHCVAEGHGGVVGIGAFYDARANHRMTPFTARRMLRPLHGHARIPGDRTIA
ncbi:MAG TPA: hypothetical protein VFA86_03625 [Gammaproteobacteria bacterium]|nr:hypothetical protein [Gammaproteobacteria bacterium]